MIFRSGNTLMVDQGVCFLFDIVVLVCLVLPNSFLIYMLLLGELPSLHLPNGDLIEKDSIAHYVAQNTVDKDSKNNTNIPNNDAPPTQTSQNDDQEKDKYQAQAYISLLETKLRPAIVRYFLIFLQTAGRPYQIESIITSNYYIYSLRNLPSILQILPFPPQILQHSQS